MSFSPPVMHNGQRLQKIEVPRELEGYLDGTLFLRGPIMDEAGGDPEKAWRALGGPGTGIGLIAPVQVHGTAILDEKRVLALPTRPRADGILLHKGQCAGSLRFADCFPLLLSSCHPHPWALMLHAGFEGTARGIVPRSIEFLENRVPGFRIEKTYAWIGPGIGSCCYQREKGRDAKTALGIRNLPASSWIDLGERVRFDIPKAIGLQLFSAGLPRDRLFEYGLCTSCNPDQLYSYRAGDLFARTLFLVRSGPAVHKFHPWWENI
jgi:copper oxidase (laccase) domain-containing protein